MCEEDENITETGAIVQNNVSSKTGLHSKYALSILIFGPGISSQCIPAYFLLASRLGKLRWCYTAMP